MMNNYRLYFELRILLWLFPAIILFDCNVVCTAAPLVKLIGMDRVEVEADMILLKDLVLIQGIDKDFVEKIAQVEMGSAPLIGKDRTLDENDIRLRLKQNQIDLRKIEILLSQPIQVARATMNVTINSIETAATNFVKSNLQFKNAAVKIKEVRGAGSITLPKGRLRLEIQPKNQLADFVGNVPLNALLHVNGKLEKRIMVTALVEVVAKVVVAGKPILKGEIIQSSHIKLQSMELSKIKGKPVQDIDFIIGKRAIHQIYPQTVIQEDDVQIPPLLKRGDKVNIIVTFSNVVATARGVVREDGRLGDRIKVTNIDSKKTLDAKIVDQGTVRIDF